MPPQTPFRMIKAYEVHREKDSWNDIPKFTRGVYILYNKKSAARFEVRYIGVGGIGKGGKSGMRGRIEGHAKRRKGWTHFSYFEVHDNISPDEILELEALFLAIFRNDPRITLLNKTKGSKNLNKIQSTTAVKKSTVKKT